MFSLLFSIRFALIFYFSSSFHNLYYSLCYEYGLNFVISVGCIVFVHCMYQFIVKEKKKLQREHNTSLFFSTLNFQLKWSSIVTEIITIKPENNGVLDELIAYVTCFLLKHCEGVIYPFLLLIFIIQRI